MATEHINTEAVRCEDLLHEAGVPENDAEKICAKLRDVAGGSELSRLKLAVVAMWRRCHKKDDVACRFYRKILNAPAWRIESLMKEYATYLKYLDCMSSYNDEKWCRRYLSTRGEKKNVQDIESIKQHLQKLPMDYAEEEDAVVVRVGKGERLPEPQFKATISELKKMGFEFDPETKLWYIRI